MKTPAGCTNTCRIGRRVSMWLMTLKLPSRCPRIKAMRPWFISHISSTATTPSPLPPSLSTPNASPGTTTTQTMTPLLPSGIFKPPTSKPPATSTSAAPGSSAVPPKCAPSKMPRIPQTWTFPTPDSPSRTSSNPPSSRSCPGSPSPKLSPSPAAPNSLSPGKPSTADRARTISACVSGCSTRNWTTVFLEECLSIPGISSSGRRLFTAPMQASVIARSLGCASSGGAIRMGAQGGILYPRSRHCRAGGRDWAGRVRIGGIVVHLFDGLAENIARFHVACGCGRRGPRLELSGFHNRTRCEMNICNARIAAEAISRFTKVCCIYLPHTLSCRSRRYGDCKKQKAVLTPGDAWRCNLAFMPDIYCEKKLPTGGACSHFWFLYLRARKALNLYQDFLFWKKRSSQGNIHLRRPSLPFCQRTIHRIETEDIDPYYRTRRHYR
ncbi:hypothetical protein SMACR_08643 [Sordaria macrospora]|uniref:Uncharacterized protein n=1 Tax=Sordaria macrospora TaxID=5147 RepID=A0A8S8ZMW7_SORMA|nr:hypothetical protein SMACR_08643 [Sordaria macrospora]